MGRKDRTAERASHYEPGAHRTTARVPFLAPVIEALKQLGRYTDAELVAAVVSGMFTVFIEKESASSDGTFGEIIPEEAQGGRGRRQHD